MFLALRNASISSAMTSISEQEEAVESGNNISTWRLAGASGLESTTRKILGWSPKTHHSKTAGPKGVDQVEKDEMAVPPFFIGLMSGVSSAARAVGS